jgi:hypothetical protein
VLEADEDLRIGGQIVEIRIPENVVLFDTRIAIPADLVHSRSVTISDREIDLTVQIEVLGVP